MRCPFCGSAETKVIDSRFNEDSYSIKRRRECLVCGARFNTLETSELNYPRVTKSDESSEVFNETKITFFDNGYYSYSNQYNYYSYKYMPEETQNRYQNKLDNTKNNNVNSLGILQGKSLLKNAKTIFKKFKTWINE